MPQEVLNFDTRIKMAYTVQWVLFAGRGYFVGPRIQDRVRFTPRLTILSVW